MHLHKRCPFYGLVKQILKSRYHIGPRHSQDTVKAGKEAMIKWLESGTGERKEIYLPYSFRKQTKQYFTASLTQCQDMEPENESIFEIFEFLRGFMFTWTKLCSISHRIIYHIHSGNRFSNENNSWAALSSGHLCEAPLHATYCAAITHALTWIMPIWLIFLLGPTS